MGTKREREVGMGVVPGISYSPLPLPAVLILVYMEIILTMKSSECASGDKDLKDFFFFFPH